MLWTASARASDVVLDWQAPPGCPSQGEVAQEIARLLPTESGGEPLQARATVTSEAGWSVAIEMRGRLTAERRLQSRNCASIAKATALVLAMAIDPEAATRVQPERQEEPEPPEPAPSAEPEEELGEDAAQISTAPLEIDLWLFSRLGASIGALPAVGAVLGGGLSLDLGVRLELAFDYSFARDDELPSLSTGNAELALWETSLGACLGGTLGAFWLGPCARVSAGSMLGESQGVSETGTGSTLWLSPGASVLGLYHPLPWLGIRAEIAGAFPVFRPNFVIEGVGEVHRAAVIAGYAGLGLQIRLF